MVVVLERQLSLVQRGQAGRTSEHLGKCDGLTQRGYECKVLQHHIAVEEPLCLTEQSPFLLGEVNGHVLEGHTALL